MRHWPTAHHQGVGPDPDPHPTSNRAYLGLMNLTPRMLPHPPPATSRKARLQLEEELKKQQAELKALQDRGEAPPAGPAVIMGPAVDKNGVPLQVRGTVGR